MNKKFLITISILLLIFIGGIKIYNSSFNLENLPNGSLVNTGHSPNGDYTLNIYLVNGGSTVDWAIRGEVIFAEEDMSPKTIYWSYHENKADIKWIDNQTVSINGHVLNVLTDTYDWRRQY